MHLLRASDGSHYVAFSAEAPAGVPTDAPFALYVRLAPRQDPAAASVLAVRSPVEEWLLGQRNDPLPMRASGVVQVPTGELPVGGPLAGSTREALGGQNQAALRLMERERERQREADEAAKKARQAEMEGRARPQADLMPFEDFDLAARVTVRPGLLTGHSPRAHRRSRRLRVVRGLGHTRRPQSARSRPAHSSTRCSLPIARTGLSLGSVIVADAITFRQETYRADQQTAHPYTIGTTEIEPAADGVFTNDEKLSVAFQVFERRAVHRPASRTSASGSACSASPTTGEQLAGSLTPLEYSERTLPADFNLLLGHPILAAMAAPLRVAAARQVSARDCRHRSARAHLRHRRHALHHHRDAGSAAGQRAGLFSARAPRALRGSRGPGPGPRRHRRPVAACDGHARSWIWPANASSPACSATTPFRPRIAAWDC